MNLLKEGEEGPTFKLGGSKLPRSQILGSWSHFNTIPKK